MRIKIDPSELKDGQEFYLNSEPLPTIPHMCKLIGGSPYYEREKCWLPITFHVYVDAPFKPERVLESPTKDKLKWNIRTRRIAYAISLRQLAEASAITHVRMSQIERHPEGSDSIEPVTWQEMAQIFRSLNDLILEKALGKDWANEVLGNERFHEFAFGLLEPEEPEEEPPPVFKVGDWVGLADSSGVYILKVLDVGSEGVTLDTENERLKKLLNHSLRHAKVADVPEGHEFKVGNFCAWLTRYPPGATLPLDPFGLGKTTRITDYRAGGGE